MGASLLSILTNKAEAMDEIITSIDNCTVHMYFAMDADPKIMNGIGEIMINAFFEGQIGKKSEGE